MPRKKLVREDLIKDALERDPNDKTIDEIFEQNSLDNLLSIARKQKERKDKEQSNIKTLGTGFLTGLATSIPGTLGFFGGLGRAAGVGIYNLTHKKEKVPYLETTLESVSEDPLLNKATEWDTKIREKLNAKQIEDLTPKEQALDLVGSLVSPKSVLSKIPGVSNLTTKTQNKIVSSAVNKATKNAEKLGKTTEEIQNIANKVAQDTKNQLSFATNTLLPGLQVTKDASKLQKSIEIGTQAGLPLIVNEITRASMNQPGIITDFSNKDNKQDEQEKEDLILLPPKTMMRAKSAVTYNTVKDKPGAYRITVDKDELDNKKDEQSSISTAAKLTGLGLAAMFTAPLAVKGVKKVASHFQTDPVSARLSKEINQTNKPFEEFLPLSTKIDNEVADRFAWSRIAEEQKLLDNSSVSKLNQDIGSMIDLAFNTGKIRIKDTDVDFKISPQYVWTELDELQKKNPNDYAKLNTFLDLNSQIQDETNRANINLKRKDKNVEFSPAEYVKYRLNSEDVNTSELSNKESLLKKLKDHQWYYKQLQDNPVTKQLLNDIFKVSSGLLDMMQKSGMYLPNQIESMRKNRTIMNQLLYIPRVGKIENPTLMQKITNKLLADTPKHTNFDDILFSRSSEKQLKNIKDYKDVIESHIKETMKFILNNEQKSEILDNMAVNSLKRASDRIDYIKNNTDLYSIYSKSSPVDDINNQLVVREIGKANSYQNTKDIITSEDKTFYQILNDANIQKEFDEDSILDTTINKYFTQKSEDVKRALLTKDHDDTIMSVIKDGKEIFYKVPKIIKYSFDIDTKLPNVLSESLRAFRNFKQYAITGKYADPTFGIRSLLYTTQEDIGALKTIADNLGIKDAKVKEYLSEFSSASKELYAQKVADMTANDIAKSLARQSTEKSLDYVNTVMLKNQQEQLRAKINSMLLTKVQEQGANLSKPINKVKNNNIFYTISTNETSTSKIKKFILENNTVEEAKKKLAYYNIFQDTLREAPQYAMLKYLGKKSGAIIDTEIKDTQKLQDIMKNINRYTTVSGKRGTYRGILGNLANVMYNYIPYGNVTMQSVVSKSRLLRDALNKSQYVQTLKDSLDPNVRNIDLLKGVAKSLKNTTKSKYFQGISAVVITPSIIEYSWNYSNPENANDYVSLSDYDRASSFVLTNFFGKGRHLRIPLDQEYSVFKNILQNYIDSYMQGTESQVTNPAFSYGSQTMKALSRSLELDPESTLSLLANVGNHNLDTSNIFKGENIIQEIHESNFESGTKNAQRRQLLNTALGKFGNWINTFWDENNKFKEDLPTSDKMKNTMEGMLENLTRTGKLWTNAVNTYNDTYNYNVKTFTNYLNSNDVDGFMGKKVKEKLTSPIKQDAYNFILSYKRNRMIPISNQIRELNKQIQSIKHTSKLQDGTVVDYNGRKVEMNKLNKKLLELNALLYKEIKNLDNLMEVRYGKGIDIFNFVDKLQ